MKIIETKVYKFDELSDKAKEKAREWWRRAQDGDNFWSECVIEDAKEIGKLLGIDIDNIYWSGFCSQGDGACFTGTWRSSSLKPGAVKEFAPKDTELHRIASVFEEQAKAYPFSTFHVTHRGHYQHQYCTEFDFRVTDNDDNEVEAPNIEEELTAAARDFMAWIYATLEKEWEYQNADDQVDDNIKANEYTFEENGHRFG